MLDEGDPEGTHSKVQVDSKEDILYLQHRLREYAFQVFDQQKDQLVSNLKPENEENVIQCDATHKALYLDTIKDNLEKVCSS
jgi:hypothetical protein